MAIETEWKDDVLEGPAGAVPVRIYRSGETVKAAPLVLHLHGGAFLDGSPAKSETVASLLSESGAVVVSADYSSATERPFPHALHYSFALLGCLCLQRSKLADRKSALYVAGEEAGGNLAAGLALMARDQHVGSLQGQILVSPMLDPLMGSGSFRKAATEAQDCRWADGWSRYLGFGANAFHPYAAPAHCARLLGLPPALVLTAEDDPMRDESLAYAEKLRKAGVSVQEHVLRRPTGWPAVLCGCLCKEPKWRESVRGYITEFFHQTGAFAR